MDPLLEKLKQLFGGQAPPPADPNAGVNMAQPWNSPALMPPPQGAPQAPPPAPPQGGMQVPPMEPLVGGGQSDPVTDALLQALRKKQLNQTFAKGGGQLPPG